MSGKDVVLDRGTVCNSLVVAGFSYDEAIAIYHEHVAPMKESERVLFINSVHSGVIGKETEEGRLLLITSHGLD